MLENSFLGWLSVFKACSSISKTTVSYLYNHLVRGMELVWENLKKNKLSIREKSGFISPFYPLDMELIIE